MQVADHRSRRAGVHSLCPRDILVPGQARARSEGRHWGSQQEGGLAVQEREEREEDQPSIYSLKTYFSVKVTLWRPSFVRISCLGFVNLVKWRDSNFKCTYLPIWEPASLKARVYQNISPRTKALIFCSCIWSFLWWFPLPPPLPPPAALLWYCVSPEQEREVQAVRIDTDRRQGHTSKCK